MWLFKIVYFPYGELYNKLVSVFTEVQLCSFFSPCIFSDLSLIAWPQLQSLPLQSSSQSGRVFHLEQQKQSLQPLPGTTLSYLGSSLRLKNHFPSYPTTSARPAWISSGKEQLPFCSLNTHLMFLSAEPTCHVAMDSGKEMGISTLPAPW